MGEHPTPEKIMQIGFGFWASKTLLSAVEMAVFTELAKRPEGLEELTGRLGLHPRSARDFLDALVALGFLERHDGKYSNTPDTDLFLDKHKPSYIGGILEMCNHRSYGHWEHLTEGLRTGLPQSELRAGGAPVFETIYADPARLKEFLKAMSGVSRGANMAIAAKFPWAQYKTVVDAGPAQGDLLTQVLLKNQHLLGVGFQPGSFFTDALPRADVIMMGHILHDWNLEEKRKLIGKAYDSLPKGGALLVYDAIIDDDRSKNAFGLMMSLHMMIETYGGFDYTGADCQGWMHEAGFKETRVEHLVGPDSMVVGIK